MHIDIRTSDPDRVSPTHIAEVLQEAGYLVLTVNVNESERVWVNFDLSREEGLTT